MGKNRLLSFNQTAGKIQEMKDNLESGKFQSDILKRIKDESKISIASPNDRQAWLLNAINAMEKVTPWGEKVFLRLTGDRPGKFSRKEISRFLKEILRARINGWTCLQIAEKFQKQERIVMELEELAKLELQEELKSKGFIDIAPKTDTPSSEGLIIP